jgi:hypothetical protein
MILFKMYSNEYLHVFAAMILFGVLCIWQDDPTVKNIMYVVLAYPLLVFVKWTVYFILSKFKRKEDI